jgi:hypothetical protein
MVTSSLGDHAASAADFKRDGTVTLLPSAGAAIRTNY